MGVHGLWRLIEPSGKTIPLEALENKILAIDISIWLHQAIKGFQDARGAQVPNAHLLCIYHRLCKLLYFRIRPIFVFDGGVPVLKKQTIAKRNQQKLKAKNEANNIQVKLLNTILKLSAVQKVISEQTENPVENETTPNNNNNNNTEEDIFKLPASQQEIESTDSSTSSDEYIPIRNWDLHTIDETSEHFKTLPADVRHDILTEVMETRKQSSWGRLHEMPKRNDDFSAFQMKRLLKRYSVQVSLEEAQKEMGGYSLSLGELEALLTAEGIVTPSESAATNRIASNENKRYLLIKDLKKAMKAEKQKELSDDKSETKDKELENDLAAAIQLSLQQNTHESKSELPKKDDMVKDKEYENELAAAIKLSLQDDNETKAKSSETETVLNDKKYENDLTVPVQLSLKNIDETKSESQKRGNISNDKEYENDLAAAIQLSLQEHTSADTKSDNNLNSESPIYGDKNVDDLDAAIQLSLQEQPSTSKNKGDFSFSQYINDEDFKTDSEEDDEVVLTTLSKAKGYMIEYTGLTPNEIAKILRSNIESKSSSNNVTSTNTRKKFSNAQNINVDNNKEILAQIKFSKELQENNCNKDVQFSEKSSICLTEDVVNLNKKETSENIIKESERERINTNEGLKENVPLVSEKENAKRNVSKPTENIELSNTKENQIENNKSEDIKTNTTTTNKIDNSIEFISDSDDSDHADFIEINIEEACKNDNKSIKSVNVDELKQALLNKIREKSTMKETKLPNVNKSEDENITKSNLNDTTEKRAVNITNLTQIDKELSTKIDENVQNIIENEKAVIELNKNVENSNENEAVVESNKNVQNIAESEETTENVNKNMEQPKQSLTVEELNNIEYDLVLDQEKLMLERNTKERMSGNISDQMCQEAQELLELFGVPYIIAPMEAEAQCAFLNEINLTDGTITDDSDIWLFGGKTVYKNFFNEKKYVLEFRAESIEHHFKLTREQMILLALLVGSDYTVGIPGIGPVTALEILASFPASKIQSVNVFTQDELVSGLVKFKNWLLNNKTIGSTRTALRSKLRNVNIYDGFPNLQVLQAYLQPKVDTCSDRFTWGKLNVNSLIDYAREKFGWSKVKSEQILNPIVRKLEQTSIQKSIKDYFVTKHKISVDMVESKMSKRVKLAVKKIKEKVDESVCEAELTNTSKRKRSTRSTKNDNTKSTGARNKKSVRKLEKNIQEVIPQKEKDKSDALKNKLKAIEVFRKSKEGPGYVRKHRKVVRELKDSNYLSESSSSED